MPVPPFEIGQNVMLRHGTGLGCYGGLNSIFLAEEQYFGWFVPVIAVLDNGDRATVELPSGHKLDIEKKDVGF